MTDQYKILIEELRHRYNIKYDRKIDDDLLVLIIRMNELETTLKNEIAAVREPMIKTKSEILVSSFAKALSPILVYSTFALSIVTLILVIIKSI